MQGLVIINGYPNGEKFIRQGKRISEELRALGLSAKVVKNGDFCVGVGKIGDFSTIEERYTFAVYLDKDKYLGRILENMGLRLFNSSSSVEICDDKLTTYLALRGKNVPLIDSIPSPLCYTKGAKPNEIFLQSVGEILGFPLVAKKSYGSFGEGVQRIHGYAELLSVEKDWLHIPHFYQRYVAKACGRDIRIIVIGGKAVAAMERVAKEGEFRSNIELGGKGREILLSAEQKDVAERTAQALGLDYCGIDLLQTERGVAVCEVNSNAFFEGIEGVTGVNVARCYAEHIYRTMMKK